MVRLFEISPIMPQNGFYSNKVQSTVQIELFKRCYRESWIIRKNGSDLILEIIQNFFFSAIGLPRSYSDKNLSFTNFTGLSYCLDGITT